MPDVFDARKDITAQKKASAPMSHSHSNSHRAHKQAKKSSSARRHIDDYSDVMKHEKPSRSWFAAYVPKPQNIAFSGQAISEQVILVLRQHPITQLGWIFTATFMLLLPFLFGSVPVFRELIPAGLGVAAAVGWFLLVFGFVLESFLKWFYNVYIVTDERIIDVDFHSLIYKNVSAAKIDNIEDTTASSGGFFAALFDYGKVTIQTAAEKREFEFDRVPHPTRVTSLINELILEEEREKIEGRVN